MHCVRHFSAAGKQNGMLSLKLWKSKLGEQHVFDMLGT